MQDGDRDEEEKKRLEAWRMQESGRVEITRRGCDRGGVTSLAARCEANTSQVPHSMALYPAPSPSHADPTLQPSYFTSSLYVDPLREDITELIAAFQEACATSTVPPFIAFKQVWRSQGWHLLHLRVFDNRTRERFLAVTFRLFLG